MSQGQFTIAEQRQFWDQKWREERDLNEWRSKRGKTLLNLLHELSLDHPKILDIGCGTGWFCNELSQFGETTGVDLSEEAIKRAKHLYPDITFIAGNLFEIDLSIEKFDVVVSQEVIPHVGNQIGYLDSIANTLKPRGYLILSAANQFVMDRLDWPHPSGHVENYLSMKQLKRLLRFHFVVLRATTIIPLGNRGILRVINSCKVNKGLEVLIPKQYIEAAKGWAGFGYSIVVLAQKRK